MIGVVAALVVLGLAVLVVLLNVTGGPGGTSTAGAASRSAGSTATATAAATASGSGAPATGPTGQQRNASQLPPSLPVVSLHESSAETDGVSAAVVSVEKISGQGSGPGYVSGPALRISLRVTNGSSAAVDLGSAAVNVYQGADRTPAPPLNDPSRRAFAGHLAPGASAEGVYVVSIASPPPSLITVEVGYRPGAPLMVFTGSPS